MRLCHIVSWASQSLETKLELIYKMVGIEIIKKSQYALAQTAQGWKSAIFKVPGGFFHKTPHNWLTTMLRKEKISTFGHLALKLLALLL